MLVRTSRFKASTTFSFSSRTDSSSRSRLCMFMIWYKWHVLKTQTIINTINKNVHCYWYRMYSSRYATVSRQRNMGVECKTNTTSKVEHFSCIDGLSFSDPPGIQLVCLHLSPRPPASIDALETNHTINRISTSIPRKIVPIWRVWNDFTIFQLCLVR